VDYAWSVENQTLGAGPIDLGTIELSLFYPEN